MIIIAAKNQAQDHLFDLELGDKLSFSDPETLVHSQPGSKIAFVGYSVWRREENGDGNLSDEQVFVIRGGQVHALEPRIDLANHSPDGLSWGYSGSGCAQLALAMLMAIVNDWERVRPILSTVQRGFCQQDPGAHELGADGANTLLIALAIERRQPNSLVKIDGAWVNCG